MCTIVQEVVTRKVKTFWVEFVSGITPPPKIKISLQSFEGLSELRECLCCTITKNYLT